MTLIQYIELEQPVHTSPFSIELDPEDKNFPVFISTGIKIWFQGKREKVEAKVATIKIFGEYLSYVMIEKCFWTMDEDGNPKKPSVFKLK